MKAITSLLLFLLLVGFICTSKKEKIFKIRKELEESLESVHNSQIMLMNKVNDNFESFATLDLSEGGEKYKSFYLAKDDLFRTHIDEINDLTEKADKIFIKLKEKVKHIKDETFKASNEQYIEESKLSFKRYESITNLMLNQINQMRGEFNSDIKDFERREEKERILKKEKEKSLFFRLFRFLE